MSAASDSARIEHARSGRVAQSLSEMGIEVKGKYYGLNDAVYRDESGWYVVATPVSEHDGKGKLYFDFETDGTRIEWE